MGVAKDTVGLDGVAFRVDVHLWHGVVVLHVGFADGVDRLLQPDVGVSRALGAEITASMRFLIP